MRKIWIFSALLLSIAATQTFAQNLPPGKWWHQERVIELLGLSDEQQTRLDTIFRDSANELIDLKAELEKRNLALRRELDAPELRRESVKSAAQALSQARARLFDREMMMLVDMRQVLSSDQWTRFRRVLENRDGMRGRNREPMKRGPGRPPRPN